MLNEFLTRVKSRVCPGGANLVNIFKQEPSFKDFGQQPFSIGENTVDEYKIIENDNYIYYGEVRKDDP